MQPSFNPTLTFLLWNYLFCRSVADEVFSITGRDPLIDVAMELEKVARSDEFFIKRYGKNLSIHRFGSPGSCGWMRQTTTITTMDGGEKSVCLVCMRFCYFGIECHEYRVLLKIPLQEIVSER